MSGTSLTINRLILERERRWIDAEKEGNRRRRLCWKFELVRRARELTSLPNQYGIFHSFFSLTFLFFSLFSPLFFFFRGEQKLELLNRDGFEVYQRFVIFPNAKDVYQAQTNNLLFSLSHSWFVTEFESTSFFRSRENDFSAHAENRVVQNFDQKSLFFNISFSFFFCCLELTLAWSFSRGTRRFVDNSFVFK